AHGQHIELIPGIETQSAQGTFKTRKNLAAQHGAAVVNQAQDQRLLAEVVAQSDRLPGFIVKWQAQWKLLVQVLLNAYILKPGRADVGRRRHDPGAHPLSKGSDAGERNEHP